MNSNDQNAMPLAELIRSRGELSNQLAYAGDYHQRKNRRAARVRQVWKDTGCDFLMTFMEFKQQGIRNKRLRELGLQPVYLAGETKARFTH